MLIREKVRQAGGLVRESGLDCWVTFTRESQINGDPTLAFLAPSHLTWHSAFVVTAHGKAFAIVGQYDKKSVEDTGAYDEVVGYVRDFKAPFLERLKALQPTRIGINYSQGSEICDGLTHGMYLTLVEALGEIGLAERLVSAEPVVSALRERKAPAEIASIREAIRATLEIFSSVAGFLKPGRTEKEVAAYMKAEAERRRLPLAWDEAMCPSVFTGPDTAGAHYAPTDRAVERGHVVNMDFGLKVDGYCSDLQRTFYVLEEGQAAPPPEVDQGFATIVRGIESAKRAMRPGVRGVDVDAVARETILDAGYEEFPHALGHQVGRFSHDGTALLGPAWEKYAHKPHQRLEAGMVFTLEPRLTVPGRGVVTIEEMVVVTADGADWLSDPQKTLMLVR
jgi:Xaa-Pro aminopeptidase